jgi:hypothetical protein
MPSWLQDGSAASIRAAISASMQDSTASIVTSEWLEQPHPRWWRGSATIDERFVVKYAWSEMAAARLRREAEILHHLSTRSDEVANAQPKSFAGVASGHHCGAGTMLAAVVAFIVCSLSTNLMPGHWTKEATTSAVARVRSAWTL